MRVARCVSHVERAWVQDKVLGIPRGTKGGHVVECVVARVRCRRRSFQLDVEWFVKLWRSVNGRGLAMASNDCATRDRLCAISTSGQGQGEDDIKQARSIRLMQSYASLHVSQPSSENSSTNAVHQTTIPAPLPWIQLPQPFPFHCSFPLSHHDAGASSC